MTKETLEKQIKGALKASLDAHGDITKNNLSSASKRISGQIYAVIQNEMLDAIENENPEFNSELQKAIKAVINKPDAITWVN